MLNFMHIQLYRFWLVLHRKRLKNMRTAKYANREMMNI